MVHFLLCIGVFGYLRFVLRVIHEYCEIFDVYCLRIKRKGVQVVGEGKVGREGPWEKLE